MNPKIMDREIIDYRVLEEEGIRDLSDAINEAITQGWQPFGGVSASVVTHQIRGATRAHFYYAQADC